MAERQNGGRLLDCAITWIRDDVTLEITGVVVTNDSKRTLEIQIGGRTRTFAPGTSARFDFPNPQRVAYLERQMTRADGKTILSWLPSHSIRLIG